MNRLVVAIMLISFAVTGGQVCSAVDFGDGGAALEGVFDGVTVAPSPTPGDTSVDLMADFLPDSVDSLWDITAGGTSTSTIVVELAAFAETNMFGIYDSADPTNRVQLFGGPNDEGDKVAVTILDDGRVVLGVDAPHVAGTFEGDCFGFYLDARVGNNRDSPTDAIFYSDTSLNADSFDHMAAY